MERRQVGLLQVWQFDQLRSIPAINHFVTDKNSDGSDGEFTLGFSSHPDPEFICSNRAQVAKAIGISSSYLFLPFQVHQTRIVRVTSQTTEADLLDTDALITNEKGVAVAVMSADCVPILLYDSTHNAIGAVHAGWRGTVARILEKTLAEMNEAFGTKGEDVIAAIGPSVCRQSYEVGEEVVKEVRLAFENSDELLTALPANKARMDLWLANKMQLLQFGVPESQIEMSNLCTILRNNDFFSARCGDKGRFAAGIALRE